MQLKRINRVEAIRHIAAIHLQELRDQGRTHTEIAAMFDLTPARVQQLCHDLFGEDTGGNEYRMA